ncbi:MAG: hypothetical protein FJY37_05370, partial [Betaproteobacteria bacterium]|nr:hypothetical protein [Betaproteobacteria bacterium]
MCIGSGGVDAELTTLRHTGGVVALCINTCVSTWIGGARVPDDDEVSGRIDRHRYILLVTTNGSVSAELTALRHAGGVVALGIDAIQGPVLGFALPCDDEVAIAADGYAATLLNVRSCAVDTHIAALCRTCS